MRGFSLEIQHRRSLSSEEQKEYAARIIAEEKQNRTGRLNISWLGMTSLEIISDFDWLNELDCRRNQLTSLSGIEGLTNLTSLDCSENNLTSRAGIEGLANLTTLDCSHNKLTSLAGIEWPANLTSLDCSRNKLTSLAGIEWLANLTSLDCTSTQLTSLAGIEGLTNLTSLACRYNQLTSLAGIEGLINLTSLECNSNELTSLAGIEGLINLNSLECCGNKISSLQPVTSLRKLVWLFCSDCVIEDIPLELLGIDDTDNCLPRVRDYWASLDTEQTDFEQYKVFILGNGQVGKTQLARRLFSHLYPKEKIYDPDIKTTHGIKVIGEELQLRNDDDEIENIKTKIWDFGGQDIYHGTHGLFLKSDAIFIVCWNKDSESRATHEIDGIEYNNYPLQYWFDYIENLGAENPKVILVETQCDDGISSNHLPEIDSNIKPIASFPFSAKNNENSLKLRAALREAIDIFRKKPSPPIGTGWAEVLETIQNWAKADAQIENPNERTHRTITSGEFEQLCKNATGSSELSTVRYYLHQLGEVFYRKGMFGDQIIIDQQWALDVIYTIFDRDKTLPLLTANNGRFHLEDLASLAWQEFSGKEQHLLLSMAIECGIVFEYYKTEKFEDKGITYIAPDYLPPRAAMQQFIDASWDDDAETTIFDYHIKFLHAGIMRAIIAQIGQKAGLNATIWRGGICFYDSNTKSICIIEEIFDNESWQGKIRISTQRKGRDALSKTMKEFVLATLEKQGIRQDAIAITEGDNETISQAKSSIRTRSYLETTDPIDKISPIADPQAENTWFISYKWSDKSESHEARVDQVKKFYEKAKEHKDNVLIDYAENKHHSSIQLYMEKMGKGQIVFFFCEDYFKSKYCMYELAYAFQYNRFTMQDFIQKAIFYKFESADIGDPGFRKRIRDYWHGCDANDKLDGLGEIGRNRLKAIASFTPYIADVLDNVFDLILAQNIDDFIVKTIPLSEKNRPLN